jgi:hypothetical protein
MLQGAAALLAGGALAWTLRGTTAALWAGPLAVVTMRVALDPVRYPWYWLALETLILLGAVQLVAALWLERGMAWTSRPTDKTDDAASRRRRRLSRRPRVRLSGDG